MDCEPLFTGKQRRHWQRDSQIINAKQLTKRAMSSIYFESENTESENRFH